MSVPGSDLLRLLGSGVTPGAERPAAQTGAAGGADFASLLTKARSGEVSSGRPVTIGRGAGIKLSEEQLAKIASVADRAEAQGATRALVLIDGMALKLDITLREITGRADLGSGGVLTGVDAVVSVPGAAGPAGRHGGGPAAGAVLPNAGAGWGNGSLLKSLAGPGGPVRGQGA
jgi:hypothetical protein